MSGVCVTDGAHIMISYEFGSKQKAEAVRKLLDDLNYRVWMDSRQSNSLTGM